MKARLPLLMILCLSSPQAVWAQNEPHNFFRTTLYSNPDAFYAEQKRRVPNFDGWPYIPFFDLQQRVNYIYAALSGSKQDVQIITYSYRLDENGVVKDLKVDSRNCDDDFERLSQKALGMALTSAQYLPNPVKSPVYLTKRVYVFRFMRSQLPNIPQQRITDEEMNRLLALPSIRILERLAPAAYVEHVRPRTKQEWVRTLIARIPETERFSKKIEKVVCKLRLETNGAVKDLIVSKSSGDAKCDSEAFAFLKKYQPYPTPLNAELLNAGLVVYFDGDMGLTVQVDDGKSEPPHIFYK